MKAFAPARCCLAHAAFLLRPPLALQLAEAAVALGPLLVLGGILGPEQLQGSPPLVLKFLVDLEAVRLDEALQLLLGREQQNLKGDLVIPPPRAEAR